MENSEKVRKNIQQRMVIASKINNPNMRNRLMFKLRNELAKLGPKKA